MDVMLKFKNDFFEERKDSLSKNHVYRNHITKFIKYLSLPDVQLSNAPARININVIEECIRYYHNEGDLNSRSTMESHLESIKNFYDYLSETGKQLIFLQITITVNLRMKSLRNTACWNR